MFTRKVSIASFARMAALATAAAMTLPALEPSTAQAGASSGKVVSATSGTSDATDFSAARRYYRGGGGAAAAAAFAGIVGTGLAIAASQDRGYYYGGPAYYGGGPYDAYGYYGAPPAYGYYGGAPGWRGGYGGYNESDYGGQPNPNW
jgi:hypothetical protein